jgi:general secretion pathway protein G
MDSASTCPDQHNGERSGREGFSLLEMMIVIAVALIIASIAMPIYINSVVRAREALVRDQLYTMRS